MNKTAIKNFAVWARRKLISEITYKSGLIGITEKGISKPLSISTDNIQFFDIGTGKPTEISDHEIRQREALVNRIKDKESTSDYKTAFQFVVEEVAYTWFNRLIAIRFMEVNDYLPSRIRVLSSETAGKSEPDMVTTPFDTDMAFSAYEKDRVIQLKHENELDELFRMLFIKQCNKLNEVLPELFEKTSDYTELLLTISFTDSDGMVSHLVNDIAEEDFTEAVEIIGWMYQYYNTEPKDEVFNLLKNNVKISKERIPAATQLFTPDWIVRYMVENSLGRLWVEGHPNESLKSEWKYYLEEVEQENSVKVKLEEIRAEYRNLTPENIKVIDPCMGSGHILVYAFDVLMQIYESYGYTQKDAAVSIIENNIFGLDIDDRAYQLAYFAIMMKGRKYDRRFLTRKIMPKLYSFKDSNSINKIHLNHFGHHLSQNDQNIAMKMLEQLLVLMSNAKEYGTILNVGKFNWELLHNFVNELAFEGQLLLDNIGIEDTQAKLRQIISTCEVLTANYDVVVTNPPYMGGSGMSAKLSEYVKKHYPNSKSDLFSCCMQKGFELAKNTGFVSMITMESWMFLSSFEALRKNIVCNKNIRNMIHMPYLGKGKTSLGINFGTSAVVFDNCKINDYRAQYDYICYFETDDDGIPYEFPVINERYTTSTTENYAKIPGSPIAYWVSDKFCNNYSNGLTLEDKIQIKQGLATGNNDVFLREWYEVNFSDIGFNHKSIQSFHQSHKKYAPYNKGGNFRKWYGNGEFLIRFDSTSYEKLLTVGNHLPSRDFYFKDGMSWTLVSTRASFGARISNEGFVFDVGGSSGFSSDNINPYLGFLCSSVGYKYLSVLNPTINVQVGDLKHLPFNDEILDNLEIDSLVSSNLEISKADWDSFEISWGFTRHPFINGKYIKNAFENWETECNKRFYGLKKNEEDLNRIYIDIYNLNEELKSDVDDKDVTIRKADISRDAKSFISYAVGCMFGRYSLDIEGLTFAGGDWDDSKYATFIPDKDNCIPITDEEYFADDIVGRFVEFIKCVYGLETLEENLDFIAKTLDNKGDTSRKIIRNYFVKDFYKDHVKTYQKRPIYWLYDSGKQDGFKALVYMHRYTADTTGVIRVDYLHKMQKIYMSEIDRMKEMAENSNNAREVAQAEKRREKLIKQLKETKEYDEKIAHLALSRIAIDLDDGVKVNYEKVQTGQDGKRLEILAKI